MIFLCFSRAARALAFLLASTGAAWSAKQTEAEYIRANYAKFEYMTPMRDGVKLFTCVYVPNDASRTYPFLLVRTPYSSRPYGADDYKPQLGPNLSFAKDGFIFVYQDVRGKLMSEGEFVNMRPHEGEVNESRDAYDTIEWLLANVPNHNGKVGIWGISYPGFYTSASIIDSHPAIKAASPQAPIADWFWDDMHHHGAFSLNLAFNFFSGFGRARPKPTTSRAPRLNHGTADGYQFFMDLGPLKNVNKRYFKGKIGFWNDLAAHPNYDDFWQARNILPHLRNIKCAVMVVGGWFDAEDLYGPLKTYSHIERQNPGIENTLVMGPWPHGGWNRIAGNRLGMAYFGFPTAEYYRKHVELPFFRRHLKGVGDPNLPEALVFETGANRWRRFDAWPPPVTRGVNLFLTEGGKLDFEKPQNAEPRHRAYISDPAKPVPYTSHITTRWEARYMTEDQRFAARRPDVLVFQTDPLKEDLTVAGPIEAELWVSTSRTAADWVVKLIDVFPGATPNLKLGDETIQRSGMQMMVRGEIIRGRFRESYTHPKPFEPGTITRVPLPLQDVLHTFKKGHRIMVQIQSSWFPFFDRNPQTYVANIFEASEDDFVKAEHRVYWSKDRPSNLLLRILE